ncbi:hypothetical protein GGR50DRAFT_675796 [Xylaria sp. CBS 124048]|nr:hypothetical protein GGR50DRAFT_675796 [Xylaria sp. CBS 124048]
MSGARDHLQDLEKHLRQLEEQVDKLIIALDEWRQWEQEYKALRTDVQALPPIATREALCQTRQAFKAELVNEKELVDIFGRDDSKKRDQIISTVSNRLDYVSKNITTLARQLETAENKLAAGRVVSNPDATDEDGLPITEIREELDEEDNVISYSLQRPGESQSQLLDALDKAGIKDPPSTTHESSLDAKTDVPKPSAPAASSKTVNAKEQAQFNGDKAGKSSVTRSLKKKSVAFTDDTKKSEDEKPISTVRRLEELYRQAKDQENIIEDPVKPADESPEDADLREDMIRYNKETMMYEMAPIVAELDLEEGSGDDDSWDYDLEEEEEDDEDQWGRSTSAIVDDDYKREMLELKERLSKQTYGETKASDDEDEEYSEGIGRITVRHENTGPAQDGPSMNTARDVAVSSSSKDGVIKHTRFAPSLGISEPKRTPSTSQPELSQPQHPEVDPLSDVIERRPSAVKENAVAPGRKLSKFRRDKANSNLSRQTPVIAPEKPTETARYAPSGPQGRTLATDILESEPANEIKEPDELDANLLHQQVAEEYYKMRNRMIGRQGGFLKENTDAIQPLEEEEGGPKRLSRFRAARLAKS